MSGAWRAVLEAYNQWACWQFPQTGFAYFNNTWSYQPLTAPDNFNYVPLGWYNKSHTSLPNPPNNETAVCGFNVTNSTQTAVTLVY